MLTPIRPQQQAFEARRGTLERARSITGQQYKVSFFVEVHGAGETTVAVNFPVKFQEKPIVTSGGELAPGSVLQATNFPWCSVMVGSWDLDPTITDHDYYIGATLVIVVGGTDTQRAIIHFSAEGKALVSPT
jgi:hypothetical protein